MVSDLKPIASLNGPAVMASNQSLLMTNSGKNNVYGTAALGQPINNTIHYTLVICSMEIK